MPTWTRRLVVAAAAVVALLATVMAFAWKSDLPLDQLKARWATGASRFVDVDGMSVHYRDEGTGTPIILLHGTASSLHTWDAWANALSASRRVVRLDLPGFGLTGPQPQSDYRMDTYVDFLDHFAARLGLGRFGLAGNSFGGALAWRFAAAHPAEVSDLILVDAGGFPRAGRRPLVFRLGQMPVVSALLPHIDPRRLVEDTTRQAYGDPARLSPEVIERYYEMALRPGNRAAFGAMTSVPYEDRTAELARIQARTLVLWGEKDSLIPLAYASRFAQSIHGAALRTYPDLGHVPMEEDGPRTVADAKEFLEGSAAESALPIER
jgi:pimeloyl-ACP methyl ester carboxylesterase